jgi:hypothetical protein
MKKVNRYKAEVVKKDGKKEYYFGPTLEETCATCDAVKDMATYKVVHRESGWVVAKHMGSSVANNVPADSLRDTYYPKEVMAEVAVATC